MVLCFNDGTRMNVESVTADGGALVIRVLRTDADTLKAKFMDPVATQKMVADGTEYNDYTVFDHITEYTGAIWEVVNYQPEETVDHRLSTLEEKTEEQTAINEGQDECIVALYEMVMN